MNKLDNLDNLLLMGPGPSTTYPNVYKALAKPTIGHMDPYFLGIMDDIKSMLQTVLGTKNELTLPMSGTGSAGMETAFVNLIEKGDNVLILSNGVFGGRMTDVATRLGANVDVVDFEWGQVVTLDKVKEALAKKDYMLVAVVHAETSTGVLNPVEQIGALVKETGALFLADCVTSLGGIPIEMDKWGVDVIYSGTQKCLSVPPGLSPVSFSTKATDKIFNRATKVPNWYLDLNMIANYVGGASRVYHHTAPINMNYALYQSLYDLLEEGLENVYARHAQAHKLLAEGLNKLGLELIVDESCRLPMLNAVKIPEGVQDAPFRSKLLNEHKIEIGGGLGNFAGKVWRIGLMGYTARPENVARVLEVIGKELG